MLIRPYQETDYPALVRLWNDCLPYDRLSHERFLQMFLLDTYFRTEGFLVAMEDDRFVGFLQAIHRTGTEEKTGYLTAFGVLPAYRRRGIGTALLEAGLNYLREQGMEQVSCNGYAPYYAFPGVDERYEEANAFLLKHGFQEAGRPVAMGLNLEYVTIPEAVRARDIDLDQEEYDIGMFRLSDAQALLRFTQEHFPYWHDSILDGLRHGNYQIIVARKDGEIVGCAQWENTLTDPPRGASGRFGPFGVRADLRSKGIGAVLFYHIVEYAKEKGHKYLWFGWAGGRNLSFYERAGCRITRQFTLYRKEI